MGRGQTSAAMAKDKLQVAKKKKKKKTKRDIPTKKIRVRKLWIRS